MQNKTDIQYGVVCFKGYESEGSRNALLLEIELGNKNIPHLFTRVPKKFVDEYALGKPNSKDDPVRHSNYCTQGVIVKPTFFQDVRSMLVQAGKTEGKDFIICKVNKGDKDLEEITESWGSAFERVEQEISEIIGEG